MTINLFKVLLPLALSFIVGIAITPGLTHYLYKYKCWKKKSGKVDPNGNNTPIFNQLHKDKEVGTPRLGGIIIWGSVLITIIATWYFSKLFPGDLTQKLDFLSRNQTWLPLFTLIAASLIGLIDDWLEISGRGKYVAGGLPFRQRLLLVVLLGTIGAWWFYTKLEIATLFLPFVGDINIGWLIIPLFIVTMVALFSSGVIDGLDGLAGGVMAIIFAAYTTIAFFQYQIDLAAFCGALTGATLAFLWFNIPPARFYMSETGILGLTTTLTVIAFLTNSVIILPIIAFPLFATVVTNIIQISSKKFRQGKKVFQVAPVHHHFEAIGWPAYKVVMRYWIITVITAITGMIIILAGR